MKIAFVGSLGFPRGLAEVNKQLLISKALVGAGAELMIISRYGSNPKETAPPKKGIAEGIRYIYASPVSYRPESKFFRKLCKILGSFNEFIYLLTHQSDILLINTRYFWQILNYCIIARLIKGKAFLIVNEDPDEIYNNKSKISMLNNFLFYHVAIKKVNGVLPISEFLIEKIKSFNPGLPIFKLPTMVDTAMFDTATKEENVSYFLFCGAAAYFDVIIFIIGAFNLANSKAYKLYLIANGNKSDRHRVESEIMKSAKHEMIVFFDYLEYEKLVTLYNNAKALLIPLRPIKRDIARFPHKIGEYAASGNPIISSNVGELRHYFTHSINALLAENYNIYDYATWMEFVINYPQKASEIGLKGRELCKQQFDYRLWGPKILNWIESIK
jgi:glycosyltransferase involved in cell wall biosynthesis